MNRNYVMVSTTLFLVLFFISKPALSEPIFLMAGPYNVSLDLGAAKENYIASAAPPKNTELNFSNIVEYKIQVTTPDIKPNLAVIGITQQSHPANFSIDYMKIVCEIALLGVNCSNIQNAKLEIDGAAGAMASGQRLDGSKIYIACYCLLSDPYAYAIISSVIPWEEGTLALLKSIHIDKAK